MDSFEKLNTVFRMVFEDDTIQITTTTTADDIPGWDSLSHVNLVVAVEAAFKIRFSQRELFNFKNVGDLYSSLQRKIGEGDAL